MNAKKAKALRREARNKTVGLPYAEYETLTNESVRLTNRCTKGVYRALKRAA